MRVAQRENSVIELESNFEQKYSGFDPSKDESYIIFEMAQKRISAKALNLLKTFKNELVGDWQGQQGSASGGILGAMGHVYAVCAHRA